MPKEILGIKTYTDKEAAAILGVTPRTLLTYITTGKLAASKIGRSWAITEKQIQDYVNRGSVVDNSDYGKLK